jgi:iron complex transport system substrate-binding protein
MFRPRLSLLPGAVAILLSAAAHARDITDMTGRTVTVPDQIETVITLGSVPVINSFVEASGNGDRIVSGLPERFAKSGRWDMQYVFAPQIKDGPDLQDNEYAPVIEKILVLHPDVALTFDQATTDILDANGVPTVMLKVQTADEAKDAVALLADLFATPEAAPRYAAFFDNTLAGVAGKLAAVPEDARPRVLYINPKNMSQPHLIAEWWMKAGGARSVTDDGRTTETLSLTTEFVLGADPDVIIVADPKDVGALKEDANLSQLRAVKEGRILVTPVGAHIWGNRTSEQPLSVLWVATKLYPDLFPEADLRATAHAFYRDFFGAELNDEQIGTILNTGPKG